MFSILWEKKLRLTETAYFARRKPVLMSQTSIPERPLLNLYIIRDDTPPPISEGPQGTLTELDNFGNALNALLS